MKKIIIVLTICFILTGCSLFDKKPTNETIPSNNSTTPKEELTGEICDLLYHCLVLMAEKGLSLEDIEKELNLRAQKQHNQKAERKPITNR